jgi:prepilin-type N-terminal cleavage/methylation domain-containing protein
MPKTFHSPQAGFSLVELMIVIVIAAVITTFAVMRFTSSKDNLQRQNVAREFKNSLERARFDAVKRRPGSTSDMSTVQVLSATSFSYTIDRNQNGVIDGTAETTTIDFSSRGRVQVAGDNFVYPVTVAFDRKGQIRARNASNQVVNPTFYFCNGSCTPLTANAANSNIVYVSPTGTVSMMQGGQTVPTFANPTVTNVNSSSSVNPMLSVWDPYVAGTPTPTPTATPVSTPTPTPTPSISPTPSPSPPTCAAGERPAQTGCACLAPRWKRNNGKCL